MKLIGVSGKQILIEELEQSASHGCQLYCENLKNAIRGANGSIGVQGSG